MTNVFGKIQGLGKKSYTERERNKERVKKEDFLIKQIDEFKEKAKQLQMMLDSKENKVGELQQAIEEREKKAQNLQQILQVKQQEADKVTQSVDAHVEQISKKLEGQIGQMSRGIDAKMAQVAVQLDDGVQAQGQQLQELKEQVNNIVAELNKGTDEQLKASVDELVAKLDTMKGELSEKVHSENVKSYRNMQTLIEELEVKLEKVELGDNSMKNIKGYLKAAIVLGVLNLIAMAGWILYETGILNYFL